MVHEAPLAKVLLLVLRLIFKNRQQTQEHKPKPSRSQAQDRARPGRAQPKHEHDSDKSKTHGHTIHSLCGNATSPVSVSLSLPYSAIILRKIGWCHPIFLRKIGGNVYFTTFFQKM